MSSQEPTLSVQINQVDHTLAPPGPLDNSSLARVPIIRIYGASSTGHKACVHIHQVYPYFFVEYNGQMNPDSVNRYIAKLNHSLNHAIAISMKRNPHSPNSQFIRAILLVKGVHFYGFHTSYSPFLKILLVDPTFVSRAVTVMRAGTVMHTRFNVYESHLSYILQFLCDFGLYGCGWMNLGEVWQRGQDEEEAEQGHGNIVRGLPTFNVSPHFRQSRLPLEVDAAAHQILNRHLLVARNLHHKLTIPIPVSSTEPLVISVRELWEDERHRRVAKGLSPSPKIPVDPSESSRGPGGEWIAEARWWDEVRKRIEKEREGNVQMREVGKGWERFVMTTFESIEALWEQEWKVWRHGPRESGEAGVSKPEDGSNEGKREENPFGSAGGCGSWDQTDSKRQNTEVDVDEALLSSQEMSRMVAIDEQEWAKLMGENRAIENEDDDEGQFEDDDYFLSDDGPPPVLQGDSAKTHASQQRFGKNDSLVAASPKTPRKRQNTSQDDSSRQKRHCTSSVSDKLPDFVRNGELTIAAHVLPSFIPEGQVERHQQVIEVARDSLIPQHEIAYQHFNDERRKGLFSSSGFNPAASKGTRTPATHSAIDPIQITKTAHSRKRDTTCDDFETENTGAIQNDNEHAESHKTEAVEIRDINQSSPYKSSSDPSSIVTPKSTPSVPSAAFHLPSSLSISLTPNSNGYVYAVPPPSTSELVGTVDDYAIPRKIYRNAYFSKESDAPDNPREYAGLLYHLKGGEGLNTLDEWDGKITKSKVKTDDKRKSTGQHYWPVAGGYEYASCPPSPKEVRKWLATDAGRRPSKNKALNTQSQVEGPTQTEHFALKDTTAPSSASITREQQSMSVFALEIFAPPRGNCVPDPDMDEIAAVFWSFQEPVDELVDNAQQKAHKTGIIVVENKQLNPSRLRDFIVEVVDTELELLNEVVDVIMDLDPDIVTGWEIQAASWGYLSARGRQYGFDIGDLISRSPSRNLGGGGDQWGMRQTSTFRANGRQVLNLWRIMRSEQNLSMYSFENVVFHVLGKRIPQYNASTLAEWYKSDVPTHTARFLRYMSDRTLVVLEVLDEAEIVTKTAEFARVFGVDFFSVISRGSQFKVESFMFRIGKPESLVFLSPSKQDVGKQNAAECMPLIMEPLSAFYNGPLVVLDFQSLYPSIMIAYNYCYSTCLGRVTNFKGRNKFGVTELDQPRGLLETLEGHINIAPNGIMYVKPSVRKGLLARMLTELLETRVMVKQAMKGVKEDKVLRRILDARQLGLKYIANVTYGYTSATYSGRMPAVEIADSIVQSGRETLEKAVRTIDATKKWGAKVVYGDTDSLFIYLRGKTKEQAFRIGYDIADTITALNPAPVKLKFEKVYLPCVLMAKKRYVGFKYENPDDIDPVFDAKGIETVRRDGVPAQQKMTETCLKILFRTQDLSRVKDYCCRTWLKILENRVSIQDFIFAKEVKMGTYSDKGPPPPGVTVAARRLLEDPNDEPQYGERVPYVIIRGEPNSRLVDRAVAPQDLLTNYHMHLDAAYYISRTLIPPLERIFNLVGANVRAWYDEMPKTIRADRAELSTFSPEKMRKDAGANKLKIDEHFRSSQCIVCGDVTSGGICDVCRLNPQTVIPELLGRIRKGESRLMDVQRICESCTNSAPGEPIECVSIDCPWLFERKKVERKAEFLAVLEELVNEIESDM